MLNSDALKALKLKNDNQKPPFGWPVKLINDLLDTVFFYKKEKQKWQDLATRRGELLTKINEISKTQQKEVE